MNNKLEPQVGGGIVCHHIPIAKSLIDGFFKEVSLAEKEYDLVVIAGPNHFGLGNGEIQTAFDSFKTDYGILEVDQELAKKLVAREICQREEATFYREHSIFALTGRIKIYFPNTKIVPLVFKRDCSREKLDQLAEIIFAESQKKKVLVVASIDFSHYSQRKIAYFHDQISASAIRSFDFDKIQKIEGDSNKSLYFLLKYLEKGNFFKVKIRKSNSAFLGEGLTTESSVSYLNSIFKKGEKYSSPRAVSVICYFNQNNQDFFSQDFSPAFFRTFIGVDLIVLYDHRFFWVLENGRFFDYFNRKIKIKELNDPSVSSLACKGIIVKEIAQSRIGFWDLNYSEYQEEEKKPHLKEKIEQFKKEAKTLIVFCRWGAGEANIEKKHQDFADFLTKSGVDIVLGSGVHCCPAEIKNNKPIFYSFEEKGNPFFQMGVGVNIFSYRKDLFLFPFLLDKEKKRSFFDYRSAENNANFFLKNIEHKENGYFSLSNKDKELLPPPWNTEALEKEVLYYLRQYAVKLNYFVKKDEFSDKIKTYERYYLVENGQKVPGNENSFMMDVREIFGYDRPISLIAKIFLDYIRKIKSQPRLLIGFETSSFPIMGAILALNDVFFPREKLEVCYIRKEGKMGDLCLQIEGSRNFRGQKAIFIDDITNKGRTIARAKEFTEKNGIILVKALVVIGSGSKLNFGNVAGIPYNCIASLDQIKKEEVSFEKEDQYKKYGSPVYHRSYSGLEEIKEDYLEEKEEIEKEDLQHLKRSEIEIAKLAKDTATALLFSDFKRTPFLLFDERGSFGYLPFLKKYLVKKGRVAVLINKRELRRGCWFNRKRGFAFSNFSNDKKNYLNGVLNCVNRALKETPRITDDCSSFSLHKPIWLSELGSLSFFVYLIEEEKEIKAQNVEELKNMGHDLKLGLVGTTDDFQAFVPGDLSCFSSIKEQVDFLLKSMNNGKSFKKFNLNDIKLLQIKGRWAFSPERPMRDYFNFLDTIPSEAFNER